MTLIEFLKSLLKQPQLKKTNNQTPVSSSSQTNTLTPLKEEEEIMALETLDEEEEFFM